MVVLVHHNVRVSDAIGGSSDTSFGLQGTCETFEAQNQCHATKGTSIMAQANRSESHESLPLMLQISLNLARWSPACCGVRLSYERLTLQFRYRTLLLYSRKKANTFLIRQTFRYAVIALSRLPWALLSLM